MAYLPNSDAERREMLDAVGAASEADLFTTIPAALRNPVIDLPPPLSEQDLVAELERLAARNRSLSTYDSFLGAGVYRRFSPAIVRGTISRPEFYTAYTPYQAEASQGTLQTIFEFQSMICALTGLDVANASLYDGATAAAEAMVIAVQATRRTRIAVADTVHPETIAVLRTFGEGRRIAVDVDRDRRRPARAGNRSRRAHRGACSAPRPVPELRRHDPGSGAACGRSARRGRARHLRNRPARVLRC